MDTWNVAGNVGAFSRLKASGRDSLQRVRLPPSASSAKRPKLSTTARNRATSVAQSLLPTLLFNLSVRRPYISRLFFGGMFRARKVHPKRGVRPSSTRRTQHPCCTPDRANFGRTRAKSHRHPLRSGLSLANIEPNFIGIDPNRLNSVRGVPIPHAAPPTVPLHRDMRQREQHPMLFPAACPCRNTTRHAVSQESVRAMLHCSALAELSHAPLGTNAGRGRHNRGVLSSSSPLLVASVWPRARLAS